MVNNSKPGQDGARAAIVLPADELLRWAKQHASAIDVLLRKANTFPPGPKQAHILALCDLEAKITLAYAALAIADQLVKHPVTVRMDAP